MTHPMKIGPYDPTLSDEVARKQRKLLRYQEEGIQRAISERTKGILLADDMGAGKTSSATEVALRLGVERVLIIAPRNALDQWVEVFDAQSDGAVKVRKMASTKAGRAAFADFLAGKPGYYATNIHWLVAQNYEYKPFFEDDGSPRWKRKKSTGELILKDGEPVQETERVRLLTFVKMKPVDLTIFDECFAAGKLIDTPDGPRLIETLRAGDVVWGYDHANSELKPATIVNVMKRQSVDVLPTGATANHPYWIEGWGYRPAADVRKGDMLLGRFGSDVRVVPAGVHAVPEKPGTALLLPEMLSDIENADGPASGAPRRAQGVEGVPGGEGSPIRDDGKASARERRSILREDEEEQPRMDAGGPGEDRGYEVKGQGGLLLPRGRERKGLRSGANPLERAWGRLGHAVRRWNRAWLSCTRAANELQDRRGAAGGEAGSRVRREQPQQPVIQSAGSAQGPLSYAERVDHLAILEPRDIERYESVRGAYQRDTPVDVYNIETDTSNYFADGVLVHNCHAIQNRNALATRTAYTIKSEWRMGLSGTWHGNSFAGAWSTAGWVWPGEYENGESIVDASFNRWVRDYCEVRLACPKCYHPVDEADATRCEQCYLTFTKAKPPIRTVIGEKVEGEFVKTLPCYIRREPFPKAPKPALVYVDISPEQRAQYAQLEEDAIAWVQDHDGIEQPIVAELPIVLRQRLRTATLAEMSGTFEGEIFFADDCRSAKMTALRGILDKWSADAGQTEPALIFADSKPFVKVLAKRMASAGYRAREWTGDLSAKQREALKQEFIAGEFDYLVATIQSLNEAVDGLQFRCSKIAWVSKSENEVLNQQAERRIWRPGVDMSAFQQVEIRANDTLDEGTFSRLAQTRARNLRQMALDRLAS